MVDLLRCFSFFRLALSRSVCKYVFYILVTRKIESAREENNKKRNGSSNNVAEKLNFLFIERFSTFRIDFTWCFFFFFYPSLALISHNRCDTNELAFDALAMCAIASSQIMFQVSLEANEENISDFLVFYSHFFIQFSLRSRFSATFYFTTFALVIFDLQMICKRAKEVMVISSCRIDRNKQ